MSIEPAPADPRPERGDAGRDAGAGGNEHTLPCIADDFGRFVGGALHAPIKSMPAPSAAALVSVGFDGEFQYPGCSHNAVGAKGRGSFRHLGSTIASLTL